MNKNKPELEYQRGHAHPMHQSYKGMSDDMLASTASEDESIYRNEGRIDLDAGLHSAFAQKEIKSRAANKIIDSIPQNNRYNK